jgi:hypothetical protein
MRLLAREGERIEKFFSENERKKGASWREIQNDVSDNDSAKVVSSHGVIQGYYGNALVDERH